MRRGANKIFFLAVLGSLAVHLALASIGEKVVRLPAWSLPDDRPSEFTVVLPDDADAPKEAEKPKPSELDQELLIGEANANGYASFESPGLQEQLARQADADQAFLSRDPRGRGTGGESTVPQAAVNSAASPLPQQQLIDETSQPVFGPPMPPMPVPKAPLPQQAVEAPPKVEVAAANSAHGPMVVAEKEPPKTADPKDVPPPTEEPRPAVQPPPPAPEPLQSVTPAAVARAQRSADPAPQTESEVDPFSKLGSVEFRDGSLSVRAGRQIKPRRPKFTLASQVAFSGIQSPRIELAITTDATGKVTSTEILKSSGSIDIDQPVRVCLYDWWFEPKKDAAGRAVPDRFKFEICFR